MNVYGAKQLVGSGLNKIPISQLGLKEGALDNERVNVMELKMDTEELLKLKNQWENKSRGYTAKIEVRQDTIKNWYLGRSGEPSNTTTDLPISSNLLFEAEETYLPAALAKNPEPVVFADNSEEGNKLSKNVKTMLQYHADTLNLRGALKVMTRQNSIYLIGVLKHGWDPIISDIKLEPRKPKHFIFDPDGFVNRFGDFEGYTGERIKLSAEDLVTQFPAHRAYITIMVNGRMGTPVVYTEWWAPNDEYTFCTFKEAVLDKSKNPFFNLDESKQEEDIDGNTQNVVEEKRNHFGRPKKPYTFLVIFNLEEQPHDMTSLIEQNIPNQRRITRRTEQMDYNLSRANNSDVFSGNNWNEETAKQAAKAIAAGRPVLVPKGGPLTDAIHRLQAPGLDASFFTELETSKQDLRQIFGTAGITTNPQNEDKTVRGKILDQQHDSSRIGGGVGDALQAVADNVFNWWVQLYHVFYDVPHYASIMGQMKAVEYVQLKASDLNKRLVISVSPDSMKPKDEVTEMNQALSLFEAGALDPKTLLTILDFPDPQKSAENAVLWQVDKASYIQLNFPELSQQLAALQQQMLMAGAGAPPGGGTIPPEQANGEPAGPVSAPPANPALSQVPINNLQ